LPPFLPLAELEVGKHSTAKSVIFQIHGQVFHQFLVVNCSTYMALWVAETANWNANPRGTESCWNYSASTSGNIARDYNRRKRPT